MVSKGEPLKASSAGDKPKRSIMVDTQVTNASDNQPLVLPHRTVLSTTPRVASLTSPRTTNSTGTVAPVLKTKMKPNEWIEVTQTASFKDLHSTAFPIVQHLLQLEENQAHPFKLEWQDYLERQKGLTAESSFHAVRTITGIKNIDDYKNILLKCPQITEYLAVKRADPRYNSKIIYQVLKLLPTARERHPSTPQESQAPTIATDEKHSYAAIVQAPMIQHVSAPGTAPDDSNRRNVTQTIRSIGQPKVGEITDQYVRISTLHDDQSFEKFLYEAYPLITSWCADSSNSSAILSVRWASATEHGLHPYADWPLASRSLGITTLQEFCDLLRESTTLQESFYIMWRAPFMYYIPLYMQETPSTPMEDIPFEVHTDAVESNLTKIEEKVDASTARLEKFISHYTLRLQNISTEINEFSNTIKYRAQAACDRVHDAGNRAILDLRNNLHTCLSLYCT